jgi:hypothetical protein
MLVDDFLSTYDVSDSNATVVHADLATTWDALMEVDLIEVGRKRPLVGVLGAIRALPELVAKTLHGARAELGPDKIRLRDMSSIPPDHGGWVLLGERPKDEIALGLVGKFWKPIIDVANVPAERFKDFNEPGYAKTVYSLSVRPIDEGHTMLCGVMRTATTDSHARRWFRRYWTFGVGSGAHILVTGLLDVTREMAESRACA